MALDQPQRLSVRKTIYIVLIIGVVIGAVLFFFGDDLTRLIRTLVSEPETQQTTLNIKLFNDEDANGEQDPLNPAEHLLPLAEITLTGPESLTGRTSESGELVITDVLPGSYSVMGTLKGSALTLTTSTIDITAGETTFFAVLPVTTQININGVDGKLVLDTNRDGVADDRVLGGVEVQLQRNGVALMQTDTADDGSFTFNAIEPGTYIIVPVLTAAQKKEYAVGSIPNLTVTMRSKLDRIDEQLLVPVQPPSAALMRYRLAQASPTAGFVLTKTGSDKDETEQEYVHAPAGQVVHFAIEITPFMAAPGTVTNVRVTDDYPSVLTPSAITGGGTVVGGKIEWSFPSLSSGSTTTVEYDAAISTAAADGYYKNLVTVSGDSAESAEDDANLVINDLNQPSINNASSNGVGQGGTTGTGNGANNTPGRATPETGVGAWLLAAFTSIAGIAIGMVLVAGFRRTRTVTVDDSDTPQQS